MNIKFKRKVHLTALLALVMALPFSAFHTSLEGREKTLKRAEIKKVKKILEDAKNYLKKYDAALDHSQFEISPLAKKLDRDPKKIFTYVRDKIQFIPYQGSLQGSRGCLQSKRGNALDKALLLKSLLKECGQKSKIVYGSLSLSQSQKLLESLKPQKNAGDVDHLDFPHYVQSEYITRHRRAHLKAIKKRLKDRFNTLFKAMEKSLPKGKKNSSPASSPTLPSENNLRDITAHHFWLQVEGKKGKEHWDPSFPQSTPGKAYGQKIKIYDKLPESFYHTLKLVGFREEYSKGKVKRKKLFDLSLRASHLNEDPLFLFAAPHKGMMGGMGSALKGKKKFQLILKKGQKTLGRKVFELKEPGGKKKKSRGGFGGLGGALKKMRGKSSQGDFTASLGMRITLKGPGVKAAPITRYLFDYWGYTSRIKKNYKKLKKVKKSKDFAKNLEGKVLSFTVSTGRASPLYLQHKIIKASLAKAESIAVKKGKFHIKGKAAYREGRLLGDSYFHFFDGLRQNHFRGIWWVHMPRIVMAKVEQSGKKVGIHFDVTFDRWQLASKTFDHPFLANLKMGLFSSIVEEELLSDHKISEPLGVQSLGAAKILEDSLAEGPPLIISEEEHIPSSFSADGQSRIKKALKAQKLVILPCKMKGKTPEMWYELNPNSGYLQAVSATGYHQASTERSILEKIKDKVQTAFYRFCIRFRKILYCVISKLETFVGIILNLFGGSVGAQDVLEGGKAVYECIQDTKKW